MAGLCCSLALALVFIISASQAAYPGKNGTIFFTSSPPSIPGHVSEQEVWTMNSNGSNPHSLTPTSEPDHGAGLSGISPNGRKIVYVSSRKFGSTSAVSSKLEATAQGDHPGFSL